MQVITAGLNTKSQVMIPKPIRELLGLLAQDPVLFLVDGDRFLPRPQPANSAEVLRGLHQDLWPDAGPGCVVGAGSFLAGGIAKLRQDVATTDLTALDTMAGYLGTKQALGARPRRWRPSGLSKNSEVLSGLTGPDFHLTQSTARRTPSPSTLAPTTLPFSLMP
jgi:bifunctional DNA-binding transcriptional regulator/antitoxin component of YhaV-PrlF toxin-antitoxin module